jgi:hypothetical protein
MLEDEAGPAGPRGRGRGDDTVSAGSMQRCARASPSDVMMRAPRQGAIARIVRRPASDEQEPSFGAAVSAFLEIAANSCVEQAGSGKLVTLRLFSDCECIQV